jgi:ligand-binding sensor domain-containing protein
MLRYHFLIGWMIFTAASIRGQEIERFEHLDTRNGLSQNAVLSTYCDQRGLMWFGTMDGLNRYNGYTFKIFKAVPGEEHVLTNNRIVEIWEDPRQFIWVKTHDGYYHYLDERTDKFTTFPFYQESEEEKNSEIELFCQAGEDEIWLGSTRSGVYYLKYNPQEKDYNIQQFLNRGIYHITNNSVRLLHRDTRGNIWIGTRQGLNMLTGAALHRGDYSFQHMFVDVQFSSVAELGNKLYFGTLNRGIIVYDQLLNEFSDLGETVNSLLQSPITVLMAISDGKIVIGTERSGGAVYDQERNEFHYFMENESGGIRSVFEDHKGDLWINTDQFGIFRMDTTNYKTTYHILTPPEIVPLVDDERQYMYEDSKGQLWIGLHGAGLALYDREREQFEFFRNDPEDLKSISSNFVHCLTEDRAGQLWVGTGQFNGGINKVIYKNPAFRQIIQKQKIEDQSDNVVRSLLQDSNGYIWAGTKSGLVYIYDTLFNRKTILTVTPVDSENMKGFNVYTMLQDQEGYIWLGTKGGGISVSKRPLKDYADYQKIRFDHYMHDPSDPASLGSNFIYSIFQDRSGIIWIGNYGGGLQRVEGRTASRLTCTGFNQSNSNLSSNEVRQVYQDESGRIWVATTFGLDLMKEDISEGDSLVFKTFNYNPLVPGSISYNDVIHIFQDSGGRLWLGTFGGGVNRVESLSSGEIRFNHYNIQSGLINDAVFGILEDKEGFIWFSTENGISRFDPKNGTFDNYNNQNGLLASGFSENTSLLLRDGRLLFGTIQGILEISPSKLLRSEYTPPVILTNFQLNNKDLDIHDENSPIRMNIEFLDEIGLRYGQNSFSIEYAALNYQDPNNNKYSFVLENFEDSWNEVGAQRKATYTNITPGRYIFRVKAANWDGSWNSITRNLEIQIHPPWYRTTLAYIMYVLFIFILAEITRRILSRYNRMRNDLRVERRVNEIKLQFFTNISHEIRTPLTLILGPLDDLVHEPLPPKILKPVEVIQRNGKKMLHLVNQLLDFRKIQNNRMKMRVEETEIVAFVREILRTLNTWRGKRVLITGLLAVRSDTMSGLIRRRLILYYLTFFRMLLNLRQRAKESVLRSTPLMRRMLRSPLKMMVKVFRPKSFHNSLRDSAAFHLMPRGLKAQVSGLHSHGN